MDFFNEHYNLNNFYTYKNPRKKQTTEQKQLAWGWCEPMCHGKQFEHT